MRIAIIDDGVNLSKLRWPFAVRKQISLPESLELPRSGITHGTICAMLLEQCASRYELIDIQITENWKNPVSVQEMAKALLRCIEEKADIICLSIGTTCLSEHKYLGPVMEALEKKGIQVVASLSNAGYMTLPGAYEQVICTMMDWNNRLAPGQCAVARHPVLGQLAVANSRVFPDVRSTWEGNSYASPVVTGWLLKQWRIHGRRISGEALWQGCPEIAAYEEKAGWGAPADNPVIAVASPTVAKHIWQLLDELSETYQLEAAAIQEDYGGSDLRIFAGKRSRLSRQELIAGIDRYVNCFLIFSVSIEGEGQINAFPYDLVLEERGEQIVIREGDICRGLVRPEGGWIQGLGQKLMELLI